MNDATRIVRRTVNRDWSLKTVLHIRVSTFLTRIPHLNSCSLFADKMSFPNLVLKINIFYVNGIEYPKLSLSCFVNPPLVWCEKVPPLVCWGPEDPMWFLC
jgi:hypothetical protein